MLRPAGDQGKRQRLQNDGISRNYDYLARQLLLYDEVDTTFAAQRTCSRTVRLRRQAAGGKPYSRRNARLKAVSV